MLASLQESWEKKLLYIATLLGKLEEEVVNASASTGQEEEDTYKTRQFNLRAQDKVYDEAQQVFRQWKITFIRNVKIFKDTLALSENKEEEEKPEKGARTRGHSPDRPKNVSTTDVKALHPEMLETSLPLMQMKDWYKKWTNYMQASGWGQEGNEKTKLAYLRTVVSDEI